MSGDSIASIIEIDREARARYAQAKAQAEKILSGAQSRVKQISEEYDARFSAGIDKINSDGCPADGNSVSVKEIEENKNRRLEWLEKQFAKNSIKWSSEILRKITDDRIKM